MMLMMITRAAIKIIVLRAARGWPLIVWGIEKAIAKVIVPWIPQRKVGELSFWRCFLLRVEVNELELAPEVA